MCISNTVVARVQYPKGKSLFLMQFPKIYDPLEPMFAIYLRILSLSIKILIQFLESILTKSINLRLKKSEIRL